MKPAKWFFGIALSKFGLSRASITQIPHDKAVKGEKMESKKGKEYRPEFLDYVKKQIDWFIHNLAKYQPKEVREEAIQEAWCRVLKHYDTIDFTRGWKWFMQRHVRGAIIDYLGGGGGFEEQGVDGASRVDLLDDNGDPLEAEKLAAIFNEYKLETNAHRMNWELIARLAGRHADVHVMAKLVLGFSPLELSIPFRVSRRRILQVAEEFLTKLDDPANSNSPIINQFIYAFALGDYFHMSARNTGYGENFEPLTLLDDESPVIARTLYQSELGTKGTFDEVVRRPRFYDVTLGDGTVVKFDENVLMKEKREKAYRDKEHFVPADEQLSMI